MLLMIHTGRRSMIGSLCGRPHEHTQQPCKRLPKTLSSLPPACHLTAVVSRHSPKHVLSPQWSQCVESHVQTSIESVRVISRLLLTPRRHAAEAYRARSLALCTLCTDRASGITRPQHGIANRSSPWAETAIRYRKQPQAYCTT